ncbi:hypothetical protein JTE90_020541 [Oedothorax gibbosus]|uniref:RNA-binding protein RO60 vWA domain-containing protein n=1 Tax=Oedothorax gibbosus TaxID=931172 RepID=A0AAV6VXS1_9ARAC|nr:hypothetical protein JTE90_020541 [Oedothorax gibbosus]
MNEVIMNLNKCAGCSAITPSHVSDILLMALVKSEATVVSTLAFSEEDVVQVDINDKMSLSDVVEHLSEVPKGPAVLSSPLNWALTKKIQFDTIIVFTHSLSATQDNNC